MGDIGGIKSSTNTCKLFPKFSVRTCLSGHAFCSKSGAGGDCKVSRSPAVNSVSEPPGARQPDTDL